MNNSYRPNTMQGLTPVVKNLLIINVLIYLAQHYFLKSTAGTLNDYFALNYGFQYLKPWQFLTYMFMHANFSHLFFNMFSLWMFGSIIERELGTKKFLYFYLVCGIGAALIQLITLYILDPTQASQVQTVGASGAIYGLLFAFAYMYPNMKILLYFIVPIKAKYLILGFIGLELYLGFQMTGNVAHFAHLGGMLFAFILLRMWKVRRMI